MSMPPPPPPVDYGSPYGGGYGAREHPQGTTVLVLGILSLVVCGLLGPVAWVMGNNALTEIDAYPLAYTNRSSVQAGRVCGIIASAILILWGVVALLLLIGALAASV